ncbi:radical SAM protein [Candidatus Fermentibacteria bacterium]|nr:radical SAM protein [Candidatus Fermentibacteria bacterium]
MRIVLVSPYSQLTTLGIRVLSSYLKRKGHSTRLVFMPDVVSMATNGVDFVGNYPDRAVDQLVELCQDAGLVGFSLATNYFHKVGDLTDRVRERISVPVVWGGVHPTVSPEECLEHADYVCVGEGEEALLELAGRLEEEERPLDVPNMMVRKEGREVMNPLRPLISDLDSVPPPDYSLDDHHVLLGDEIVPLTELLMREFWTAGSNFDEADSVVYETIWTRGCPYHCSFCINDYLLELYQGERFYRKRSVEHLMSELVSMREMYPWFNRLVFVDDCFAAVKLDDLRAFTERYRDEIGLPFFCLLTEDYMIEKRLQPLLRAGLNRAEVGLQSASDRTNRLYKRGHFSPDQLVERSLELQRMTDGSCELTYDIILDNPFESVDSIIRTFEVAMRLPQPRKLQLFSLTYFPGTELHKKALEEGVIEDPRAHYLKEDHHREARYVNILFTLLNKGAPGWLLKVLSFRPLVKLMETPPLRFLIRLLNPLYHGLLKAMNTGGAKERFALILNRIHNRGRS